MKEKKFGLGKRGLVLAMAAGISAVCMGAGKTAIGGEPPNEAAEVKIDQGKGEIIVNYNGQKIFDGVVEVKDGGQAIWIAEGQAVEANKPAIIYSVSKTEGPKIEQKITLRPAGVKGKLVLVGKVKGSGQAFAAETLGEAQKRFAIVRNTVGVSNNLRNNAIYDRGNDWVLAGPGDGRTRISFLKEKEDRRKFSFEASGGDIEIVFKPRFYQKHKNLAFFEPWKYKVWQNSVTGWCSWWPYRDSFNEADLKEVVSVFSEKRLGDFGYKYIQIDLCYQTPDGWQGTGTPQSWLTWNQKWPSGIDGAAAIIRSAGLEPGIWTFAWAKDAEIVKSHKDWFVPDSNGAVMTVPWLQHAVDPTSREAMDTLIRPTYKAFREKGFTYVKVDGLRHMLYDALYPTREYFGRKGVTAEEALRRYIEPIREELGRDVYMLSCWGALPEVIGIADGCRLGGDGFGPVSLQQYNSWNGVVWRNDPDHCDLVPDGLGKGDVKDSIIRPVLVSMAGGVLMLTDRPDVYRDDQYLEGAKRSSPILFTVPGQLYDYDPVKTDNIAAGMKNTRGGSVYGPYDADQQGNLCQWWLLEINRPFESWNILARFSWSEPADAAWVKFADLGLAADREYIVYEFYSHRMVGIFREVFPAEAQAGKDVRVYAIREKVDRPQVISTSRHISQGGVDLVDVKWDSSSKRLSGRSSVVAGDRYMVTVYTPPEYELAEAKFGQAAGETHSWKKGAVRVGFVPEKSGQVDWQIDFAKSKNVGVHE